MAKKLSGKVAIVTGASKGIGASIAKHLAEAGASVVVNYSSSKKDADKVVSEITGSGGKAVAIQANLSNKNDIERLFAESKKELGSLDILVNNAGIYGFAPVEEITEEQFHSMFNLNVLGLILASQQAVKYFPASGGNIINIGSVVATLTPPNAAVYSATKAAVDAVTTTLATELGSRKIRVNSINPGMVETEGTRSSGIDASDMRKQVEATTPLGRIGQPDDIGTVAVFLASPDSGWITGQKLIVAGGYR